MLKRTIAGTSTTYIEGFDKVTGRCRYTFDMAVPNMLVGKLLYSEYPRARITKLDVSAAMAIPGVEAAVTHRDLPHEKHYGHITKDQPIFAIDEVHYLGDVVAGVAALDEDLAEEALKAIEIEYEPLPGIFDPLEAKMPGARLARSDLESNIIFHQSFSHGNAEAGFTESDVIFEQTYHTGAVEQLFLETEGAIAVWEGDSLTVYAGGQYPHRDRIQLADMFGIPASKVRIVYPYIGGGFGGKDELHTQPHVALLAWKTRHPVKLIRNRYESFLTHVKRHQFFITLKTGIKSDGTITALDVEAVLDAGPFTNMSLPVAGFAAEMSSGPYNVPNARVNAYTVATNNLIGGAMRGFGGPEMAFAQEQNLDIVAEMLGMDPLDVRLKNGMQKDSQMPSGAYIHYDIGLKKTMTEAAKASNWYERDQWLEREPSSHLRRGMGVASIWHGMSIGRNLMDFGRATVEMAPDGSVVLQSGTAEIGSGARTAQMMIVADALGVTPDVVRVADIDTEYTPDAGPTTASRSLFIVGNAILEATETIRNSLLNVAADEMEAAPEDLELGDGLITVRGTPASVRHMTIADAARIAWDTNKQLRGEGQCDLWVGEDDPEPAYPVAHTMFLYATQIAQVLVDVETGQVKVEKIWAAHDVGKEINPLGLQGQVDGGVMQGVGTALMEELQLESGRLLNPSLEGYLIPSIMDTPEIETIVVEVPEPHGPFGAKGVGEATLNPTAAAIANAIADAIGVHLWEMPMTPERILAALKDSPESP